MKRIAHNFSDGWGLALLLGFGGFAVTFPVLFFLKAFPMATPFWALQDPAVSGLMFIPGHRILEWEFFHNQNGLWTNLRALGAPLLANEIQAAPLFPLTWLLFPIPEPYFWNVLVIVRSSLIATFCFLLARRVFGFSRSGAFVFMITVGFALYTIRWLNHPWTNGFLSALVYLYAILSPLSRVSAPHWKRLSIRKFLLQVGSVYMLITCGFPEANILGAFLAVFLWVPAVVGAVRNHEVHLFAELTSLLLSHAAGFCLASPQLFALLEFLRESGSTFRSGPGVTQIPSGLELLHMITRTREYQPATSVVHYFNLIPLLLFGFGIAPMLKRRDRWSAGAWICLAFAFFKFFPTWPLFNRFIGSLPVLEGTWFVLYLFPILLVFFGFVSARGAEVLVEDANNGLPRRGWLWFIALGATLLVFCLAIYTEPAPMWPRIARVGGVFILYVTSVNFVRPRYLGLVTCAFLLIEFVSTRPPHFLKYDTDAYRNSYAIDRPLPFLELIQDAGLRPLDVREFSYAGALASVGIATLNNGSPPIVPSRLRMLLSGIFETWPGWGVSMPVRTALIPDAHRLVSVNVYNSADLQFLHPNFPEHDLRSIGEFMGHEIFRDDGSLTRGYLAAQCAPVDSAENGLAWIKSPAFKLGSVAVENLKGTPRDFCSKFRGRRTSVPIIHDRGGVLELEQIAGPAILVLNDLFYPGWIAQDVLSGASVEIHPGNVAFRTVLLPEARAYKLSFRYVPPWLHLAKLFVCAGLLLIVLICCSVFVRSFWVTHPANVRSLRGQG